MLKLIAIDIRHLTPKTVAASCQHPKKKNSEKQMEILILFTLRRAMGERKNWNKKNSVKRKRNGKCKKAIFFIFFLLAPIPLVRRKNKTHNRHSNELMEKRSEKWRWWASLIARQLFRGPLGVAGEVTRVRGHLQLMDNGLERDGRQIWVLYHAVFEQLSLIFQILLQLETLKGAKIKKFTNAEGTKPKITKKCKTGSRTTE